MLSEQLRAYFDLAREIRGKFLGQTTGIEMLMNDIITRHFCPKDQSKFALLFSLLAKQHTFHSRIEAFRIILTQCYPNLLKKYPHLLKEIDKIRKFRNKIVHSMLDTSDSFLKKYNDRIRLDIFKQGKKTQCIVTKADSKKRLVACSKVVKALLEIQKVQQIEL